MPKSSIKVVVSPDCSCSCCECFLQKLTRECKHSCGRLEAKGTKWMIWILYFYLFLAALGLGCCTRAFSSCGERGLLFVAVRGLLIAVASLVRSTGSRRVGFSSCGSRASVVVARGLSGSAACGIFPDQRSNPCPLHWQVDS